MNPQRTIDLIGGLLVAAVLGLMAYNAASNPVADKRGWLANELTHPNIDDASTNKPDDDFLAWQKAIADNADVWRALSAPPAPPAPPPPPPCKPPTEDELKKQLTEQGIVFTRAQIGQKIKVVIGGDKRGTFVAAGEAVKNFTLKSFDRTSVTLVVQFSCPDKKEVRDIELKLDRE